MLSLDLGEARDENLNNTRNGLPIVQLEEGSGILRRLLLLIYPNSDATVNPICDIETIVKVGQAARKYAMDEVIPKLRSMATRCWEMTHQPLRVFAVGVLIGLSTSSSEHSTLIII